MNRDQIIESTIEAMSEGEKEAFERNTGITPRIGLLAALQADGGDVALLGEPVAGIITSEITEGFGYSPDEAAEILDVVAIALRGVVGPEGELPIERTRELAQDAAASLSKDRETLPPSARHPEADEEEITRPKIQIPARFDQALLASKTAPIEPWAPALGDRVLAPPDDPHFPGAAGAIHKIIPPFALVALDLFQEPGETCTFPLAALRPETASSVPAPSVRVSEMLGGVPCPFCKEEISSLGTIPAVVAGDPAELRCQGCGGRVAVRARCFVEVTATPIEPAPIAEAS